MNELFDRRALRMRSLFERENRVTLPGDLVDVDLRAAEIQGAAASVVQDAANAIDHARRNGRPVIMAFGAHAIKNGLAPVFIELLEEGWVTHLATNGAGIIHDWELAYQGKTSEDVRTNQSQGTFGLWDETVRYLNLALILGAFRGLGYGASVGAMIEEGVLKFPGEGELQDILSGVSGQPYWKRAAAADLLEKACHGVFELHDVPLEFVVEHGFPEYSVQATAYRLGVPLTGHPMFGHDIIYTSPLCSGAAIGRSAERDFLRFTTSISHLSGGVYLSIGSAIMSPMVFEKAYSMAQNVAVQNGEKLHDYRIFVNDLHQSEWDWGRNGEPSSDSPAYYLRFLKSFARVCSDLSYVCADNRAFLSALAVSLRSRRT